MEKLHTSQTQKYIWLDHLLSKNPSKYNIGGYVALTGSIDVDLFKRAIRTVLETQEAYRSRFFFSDNNLFFETIDENLIPESGYLDFASESNAEDFAIKWVNDDFKKPFAIESNIVFNIKIIRVSDSKYLWYTKIHHIISDGWSFMLLMKHVKEAYNSLSLNSDSSFKLYKYSDYVSEEIGYRNSAKYIDDQIFWLNEFSTIPEDLFRNTIRQPDPGQSSCSKTVIIGQDIKQKIDKIAAFESISTSQVLTGLILIYFSLTQQKKHLIVAMPILNRGKKHRSTAGAFMNLICSVFEIDHSESIIFNIKRVRSKMFSCLRHQQYQYGDLLNDLKLNNENRLLHHIKISYEEFEFGSVIGNAKAEAYALPNLAETDPISFYIRSYHNNGFDIRLVYNTCYVTDDMAASFTEGFNLLIDQFLNGIEVPLNEVQIISQTDINEILCISKGIQKKWDNKTFLELWDAAVKNFPQNVAITTETDCFTYDEISVLVDRLTSSLKKIRCNDGVIAIYIPRTEYSIVAMIACIKAGLTYIPIDFEEPVGRIIQFLDHAKCRCILISQTIGPEFDSFNLLNILDLVLQGQNETSFYNEPQLDSSALCYIMFTSGTTGIPKGVGISHHSMNNYINHFIAYFNVDQDDVIIHQSSVSFDTSIEEIFPVLASGGRIYILQDRKDLRKLSAVIDTEYITILSSTPLVLKFLDEIVSFKSLRKVISGGDILKIEYIKNFLENNIDVYNTYGPTEATVCACYYQVKSVDTFVPIGKPISNVCVYVLNEKQQIQPFGVEGDIYIGGEGLAAEYVNDKPLYARKFLFTALDKIHKLYYSGDTGRINKNGFFEFSGRNDTQIKIRGVRVELSEIENIIQTHSSVKSVVVLTNAQNDWDKYLIAYVIPVDWEKGINQGEIDEILSFHLTEYMRPRKFFLIRYIPLTPRGKIDHKFLYDLNIDEILSNGENIALPVSRTEFLLYGIWEEILQINGFDINGNFFNLGGHSLKAIMMSNRIIEEFSVVISLSEIFSNPTIKELAILLDKYQEENYDYINFD